MTKNGPIKEIQQLLSSAKQNTRSATYKKQCKILTPIALVICLSFMAQTTYILCKLSEEIKETKQAATKLQHDLAHVHALNLKTPPKKSVIL